MEWGKKWELKISKTTLNILRIFLLCKKPNQTKNPSLVKSLECHQRSITFHMHWIENLGRRNKIKFPAQKLSWFAVGVLSHMCHVEAIHPVQGLPSVTLQGAPFGSGHGFICGFVPQSLMLAGSKSVKLSVFMVVWVLECVFWRLSALRHRCRWLLGGSASEAEVVIYL